MLKLVKRWKTKSSGPWFASRAPSCAYLRHARSPMNALVHYLGISPSACMQPSTTFMCCVFLVLPIILSLFCHSDARTASICPLHFLSLCVTRYQSMLDNRPQQPPTAGGQHARPYLAEYCMLTKNHKRGPPNYQAFLFLCPLSKSLSFCVCSKAVNRTQALLSLVHRLRHAEKLNPRTVVLLRTKSVIVLQQHA